MAVSAEQPTCGLSQRGHRVALAGLRVAQGAGVSLPRNQRCLGADKRVAGREQRLNVSSLGANQLVYRPCRHGRLASHCQLLGLLAPAILAQRFGERLTGGDEFLQREAVELLQIGGHGQRSYALAVASASRLRSISPRPPAGEARSGDPRVAVVMITRNGARRIATALTHLVGLPERPQVIVVDNGSDDGTRDLIGEQFPGVEVVAAGANLGAAGRSLGADATTARYLAFAEDDSWYEPGAVVRAADVLDAHPEIALVQAHVLVGDEQRPDPLHEDMVNTPVRDDHQLPGHPILSFLEGACVVRRSAYIAAGGFDPRLFVGGGEEHLAADLLTDGWRLRYVPEVVAHHRPDHGQPSRSVRRAGLCNTLWFAWGRRPPRAALRWSLHVVWQSGPTLDTAAGLALALRGLPRVLLTRRPLPDEVEREMALLDEPKRRSRARTYSPRRSQAA